MVRRTRSMLFIIDFDGTVAPTDTVDALLEQFADPAWRQIEDLWTSGRINSQECLKAQLALVRAERPALEEFLHSVAVDPSFAAFVRYVRPFADLAIVSDGLDYPIRHAMQRLDLAVPVYSNAMQFRSCGLDLAFPYSNPACEVKSGVCKCAVARGIDADRGLTTILVGDGQSDRCVAKSADYVFAKSSLRKYCDEENIIYSSFETFADVLTVVQGWASLRQEDAMRESFRQPATQTTSF